MGRQGHEGCKTSGLGCCNRAPPSLFILRNSHQSSIKHHTVREHHRSHLNFSLRRPCSRASLYALLLSGTISYLYEGQWSCVCTQLHRRLASPAHIMCRKKGTQASQPPCGSLPGSRPHGLIRRHPFFGAADWPSPVICEQWFPLIAASRRDAAISSLYA